MSVRLWRPHAGATGAVPCVRGGVRGAMMAPALMAASPSPRSRYGIVVVTVTTEPSAKVAVTEKLMPGVKGEGL